MPLISTLNMEVPTTPPIQAIALGYQPELGNKTLLLKTPNTTGCGTYRNQATTELPTFLLLCQEVLCRLSVEKVLLCCGSCKV